MSVHFEKQLSKFDICALLKVLNNKGYDLDDLCFSGNMSFSSSSTLCSQIIFAPDASSATVTLNLGLLIGNSPLPSYFRKCMEKGEIDEEGFVAFLQFFNHHLIKNFLTLSWVEKFLVNVHRDSHFKKILHISKKERLLTERTTSQSSFTEEWKNIQLANLTILGLDSVSSIHWVFALCFPELELYVKKCIKDRKVYGPDFCLGVSLLGGKNALGGYMRQTIRAYSVSLTSDIEQTDKRVFWPTEIRARLRELIFPLIRKTHIYLIVFFTINQYNRATYLNFQSRMGFTSLGETTSNFTWKLFEGYGH